MLTPLGLGSAAKKTDAAKQQKNEDFYGRLEKDVDQFHETNKKWPSPQEAKQLAAALLAQGATTGSWFGLYDSNVRQFEVEDQSKFYVPLPPKRSPELAAVNEEFKRRFGHPATYRELQAYWTVEKLRGGK
jgi:hypothetical protein